MTKQMDILKEMTPDSFWGGVIAAIVGALAIKTICTFFSFIKWLFYDYSNIRKEIKEIKIILDKIEKSLEIKK